MKPATVAILTSDPGGPVVRHRFRAYEDELRTRNVNLHVVPWPKGRRARDAALAEVGRADATIVSSRLLRGADGRRVRERCGRLGFDYDDALPFRDSGRGATMSRTRGRRFRAMLDRVDRVTAGNAYLAALSSRDDVRILPTTVDTSRAPTPMPSATGGVIVGWIGSRATLPYLVAAAQRLRAVATQASFTLRVVADAAPVIDGVPVEHVPWAPDTWQGALAGIHVGIAPLPDDAWTRGKCGLKVLQMMAAGRPVVANPVGVQGSQIQEGFTGFHAETDARFVSALTRLVQDAALRARLGAAAFAHVHDHWSVEAWRDRQAGAVLDLLG